MSRAIPRNTTREREKERRVKKGRRLLCLDVTRSQVISQFSIGLSSSLAAGAGTRGARDSGRSVIIAREKAGATSFSLSQISLGKRQSVLRFSLSALVSIFNRPTLREDRPPPEKNIR